MSTQHTVSERFGVDVVGRRPADPATANRGSILPQANSPSGSGLEGRGAYREPDEFTTGSNSRVGVGAREASSNRWPGYDGTDLWPDPSDDWMGGVSPCG